MGLDRIQLSLWCFEYLWLRHKWTLLSVSVKTCLAYPHVSLLPLLTVTMDKEMVPAPVTRETHIIIPSSLQGDRIVQINHSCYLSNRFILSSAHVLSHVFPSGACARHHNYSNKPEFYKDKYISMIYWRRPCGSLLSSRTQDMSHILMIAGQLILPSEPRGIQRDIWTFLIEKVAVLENSLKILSGCLADLQVIKRKYCLPQQSIKEKKSN